jgi:hypothetical protein
MKIHACSFVLAGTESVVMSLWPVCDYANREIRLLSVLAGEYSAGPWKNSLFPLMAVVFASTFSFKARSASR